MSGASTPEGDTQLLNIGQQCSASLCNLVDFLPFRCQHCNQAFCGEHFTPAAHKCAKYDESKHNRVAPSCPLCNTPVAIPPGQDPNIRMERHINTECSVMTGRTKNSSAPHCARTKCNKVLFAPIKCDKCQQQFCPQHRFPNDHACRSTSASASSSKLSTPPGGKPAQPAAASAAAMAAIKRAMNNASSSASSLSSASTRNKSAPTLTTQTAPKTSLTPNVAPKPSSSASRSNPFSATDRSSPPRTITAITIPRDNTNNDPSANDNDPPQHCSPKQPSSGLTSSLFDPLSFVPRPLFATA